MASSRRLRVVFFGTPEFAVPTLETLIAGRHDLVGVVSQPDRRQGRGRRMAASPVSQVAQRENLPLMRPDRIGDMESAHPLRALEADLGVVVAYGQFIPKQIREMPKLGLLINGHASLLPGLRGAAPIQHAILQGLGETGISIMRVVREMDAGPVALQRTLTIEPEDDSASLGTRLAALCAECVDAGLDLIADDRAVFVEQDEAKVTYAPKIGRQDAELDFCHDAIDLARRVRAMAPSPGARTSHDGTRLTILAARAVPDPTPTRDEPGTIRKLSGDALGIATGSGWLVPLRVQRAGGRAMEIEAYLRGHPIDEGARLGS
ncbi:methionyl-tRNA formyltransferase [Myxococcota bacterium]|nr:methionyl-tRNA formyltransferase [Myxococcota bacterium]